MTQNLMKKLIKANNLIFLILSIFFLVACEDESKKAKSNELANDVQSLTSVNYGSNQNSSSKFKSEPIHDYSKSTFKILDFSERDYKGVSSLGIVLSVPLEPKKDFQKYFVLEKRDGGRVDGAWILSKNGKELFFKNIEPEKEYLLTVYANLKASNDQELGERYKNTITTRAIESSVSFAHDGGILPLTHSKGLPVYSTNIKQVDIEFHRVNPDKMMSFLKSWRGGKQGAYRLDKYTENSDLVYSARFDLPIEKNKRERVILSIDHIDTLKHAGIYMAVMKVPGQYDYRQAVTYFIRSDIGIHVRRYPGKLDIYTRSLVTGAAMENVKVSLLDENSQLLTSNASDKSGIVSFSTNLKKSHLILSQKGTQMSIVRLNSPALDLSEYNLGTRPAFENEAFIYAPRDLYRPGERVEFSMLLRNSDGQLIPDIPLQATVKQEDGQVVEQFTWRAQELGYYYHKYDLAKNAKTGLWHIEVKLPGDDTPRKWTFLVEDFLPERMKLTLDESDTERFVEPEKTIIVQVNGQYLYGAPASGNRLESTIHTYIDQEAIESLPGYFFGLSEEENARKNYELKNETLNEKGLLNLNVPSTWKNIKSPIVVKLTSSLFETGGRAIKRQAKYRVWPDESLIGIRPHTDEPQANTLLKFDVVNANQFGQLLKADDLHVSLIKKRRDYYWSYNDSDEWEMNYSEKQYPVLNQTLSIKEGEKKLLELPVEWGEYRLEVLNPKNQLMTNIEFNAGGSWYYENEQSKITRPDKINLVLNKKTYRSGDVAQVLIKSPFKGNGIVIVENNQEKLWQKNIELNDSNEYKLDIPISSDWKQHDIYISTVLFNRMDVQQEKSHIKRAVGLAHLPLDRTNRQIKMTLNATEKSKPFSKLPVTIQLDNDSLKNINLTKNKEKKIRVTLAAVDVGVLNVSNYSTPDPFSWFFAQRRYAVDSLDLYGNIMDGRSGLIGQQRFGGDMDVTSAGNLQKSEVKIVSLFQQPVLFDEQGMATVSLDIPDFNGQLRLMALAFDENSFGQAEKNVTIAAPLVTQLSMPRFLAANDESKATLDIHNLSGKKQTIHIALESDAKIDILESVREISLEEGEKTVQHFVIRSQSQFGLSDISLSINSLSDEEQVEDSMNQKKDKNNDIDLQRHWQLAIRPAWPAVIRNKKQIIDSGETAILKVKTSDLMSETLTGEVIVSNQPPINLSSHLEHLLKYPYGCLEQTTSSSFPWLFASEENISLLGLKELKIKNSPIDFSKRKQYLSRGVQRLSAKQLSNGGFGLWSNQSSEEFWLSVYASHFLIQSKDQGVDVPGSVLKPAIKRLQQYLRSTRPGYDYRYSQAPEHLTLAYKSYAAYVLSMIKQAPLGTMRTLYDYHKNDAHSGLPLMHLGIALSHQGDKKRGKAAINESLTISRKENSYLGDYGSKLRDVSLMLEVLVLFNPTHGGVNQLLSNLQDELTKRQWLSTQERNALFMTGVALKSKGKKQWQAIISTAIEEKKIIHEGDYKQKISQETLEYMDEDGIELSSLSDERLYASINIGGYTIKAPEADFSHFNINRTYYNVKGEVILPEQVAVGELMIVELSLQAKNRIQDALVVDLLPAGFEIENQNLEHSIKLDEYHIGSKALIDRMSSNDIKYQAWRDDRYVAAIDIKSHTTQRLYYLLRAVTPGTYQVPPPYAEDMYRPYIRAIGESEEPQKVINRSYKM
ncbi:MAG: alpha-2-macroglobulin family protein [Gammaproteobacteria bacterium]|nr:alpha-2-macroglobulin family protein [Gammaproteobacteria bacterium]